MNAELLLAHFNRISAAPDAVARLRLFVLDLAVRGKLVEQHPDDEWATKLMNRVAKQRSQKAGTGTAGARAIVFNASDPAPFSIPASWVWVRLGDICSKTGSGSTPRGGKAVYQNSGIPFLRSQNVHNDGLRLDDVAYISDETHERMSGTAVEPNDLLLNITGGSIGRCCLVPKGFDKANISQHVAIIRTAADGVQGYLHQLVLSPYFQAFVIGEQTGAGRLGLPKNKMDRIPVALPPLLEQQRIVEKVDELMALCDGLEATQREQEARRDQLTASTHHHLNNGGDADELRNHAQVFIGNLPRFTTRADQIKQLRQTILNLAVRGKLIPTDPTEALAPRLVKRITLSETAEEPFTLPSSWLWARVEQVAETRLGKMLDKAKNVGKPQRYLRNINVRWFDFDLSDLYEMRFRDEELEEFSLRAGDVLICEGGEPGRAAVWDDREQNIYFQKAIHRVRFPEGVDPHFFLSTLRQSADNGRLSNYFTGVGIKHFTGRGLASFSFPIPPLAEQHRIVAKVDELMALCDQLEASLTTAQTETSRLLESVLHHALQDASLA